MNFHRVNISILCICTLSCLVMSVFLWPHGLQPARLLAMEFFQARILEQVAVSCSRRSFWPRDGTCISYISCIGMWLLCHWATQKLKHVSLTIAPKSGNKTLPEPGSPPVSLPVVNLSSCNRSSFSSVQFIRSVVSDSVTPWTAARQASLSITNSWSLPKLMSIESVMPSNHLILCRPLLLPPSIFPSIRVFSKESVLHMGWPKYWRSSFSISPSNEQPGLISFRMDWLISLQSKGLSGVFSNTTVQKHQFFGIQLSL